MATNPMSELIELVNSEASRLGGFLSQLDEASWSRDSACEGWKVGDVLGHLASGGATWANTITRAINGDAGPPEGGAFLQPGERGSSVIAQAAIAINQEMGAKLLDTFSEGYDRLRQVMAGLKPEDWDKPCFHRRGPMPLRDYVAVRLQELAVHSWDIRSGLDPSAQISQETLPWMVGRVQRWVDNAFRPGLNLPSPVTYRFDVAGPVPVREDFLVNGDSFQRVPNPQGPADVTFECDTGIFILLIFGRLEVDRAVESGRLAVQGSMDLAANFTSWFEGF